MSDPPWRSVLETARQRLIAIPNASGVRSLLVETRGLPPPKTPAPQVLDLNWRPECCASQWVEVYREPKQVVHADGTPVYGDNPMLDGNGKPITTWDGKYPVFVQAASRQVFFYGNTQAAIPVDSVATALGCSLAVRNPPHPCIDPSSVLARDPLQRWVYVVFDLECVLKPVSSCCSAPPADDG